MRWKTKRKFGHTCELSGYLKLKSDLQDPMTALLGRNTAALETMVGPEQSCRTSSMCKMPERPA